MVKHHYMYHVFHVPRSSADIFTHIKLEAYLVTTW